MTNKQSLFLGIWQLVKWLWTYHFEKNFITFSYPYATLMKRSYMQENLTKPTLKITTDIAKSPLTITKIYIFGLSNLSVKHIETHVNDLNSWLLFSVNSAVYQLNQWHIYCHSPVSSWNLHVLSAFCRYSGKTVALKHPHTKPWTLIMTFWQASNEPWSLVINLRWFYVEAPLYKYLRDIRQVFVTSPNVFLYTRLPVCNVCAIRTFQMRFLSTFKSQMSVEICFPCVLFMTLGTWKMEADVCCRCSLRACSNCTLITHKPVLCGVSQKRSDRLCSS